MNIALSTTLQTSFDDAVGRTRDALAKQGFGILTEIDVKATLKEKLGDAMFLHRNTIQYRVAQAMERCRHSFDEPDAMLDVQIALQVCRWLGPAVVRAAEQPTATR